MRRLVVDPESDEWTVREMRFVRAPDRAEQRPPTAAEYSAWTAEQLAALRLDPLEWVAEVNDLDPWELDREDLASLRGWDDPMPEIGPLGHQMDQVKSAQSEWLRAEAGRVCAALTAWWTALAEVEGTPDDAVNSPFRRGVLLDLAVSLQVSESVAGMLVHTADRLATDLPVTWARFVAGAASWRTMQMVHAELDGLARHLLPDFDARSAAALDGAVPTLRQRLRRARERIQASTAVERHGTALRERRVELEPSADGMAWLHVLGPAAEVIAIDHQLSKAAVQCHGLDGETRTIPQLRADILVDLLIESGRRDASDLPGVTAPRRRGVEPTVAILIPAMTAMGHAEVPATLQGYGPIDIETAKRLAGRATSWIKVLTDPVTGAVLTVGREKYRPTADMRALLGLLDGGGRGYGCRRRPDETDVDHVVPFRQGPARGQTAIDNLVLLSRLHHVIKTSGVWSIVLDPVTRELWWTSAWGTRFSTGILDPLEPTPVPSEFSEAVPGGLPPEDCPF